MRLLNPSPGELYDRLSILELKISFGQKKGIDTTHFEAEKASVEGRIHDCLNMLMETGYYDDDADWERRTNECDKHRNGLSAVNALLWDAEDSVRALPETEVVQLARLAKQIAAWNDSRAQYVRDLDKLYGIEEGPEKLHSTTQR